MKKPGNTTLKLQTESDFILYSDNENKHFIQVKIINEDVWVTQNDMAQIFGVNKPAISKHLKNIFNEGELNEKTSVSKMEIVVPDQRKYQVSHYNLDAIIAVGYRVNSKKATRFRQWATKVLKEYTIKGFALDDQRLKNNTQFFKENYLEELLARIREIRASEKNCYQKITDIFTTSYDYDKNSPIARSFFATTQNALEYAITGKTAAEIIKERANHTLPNMGLTTWKNSSNKITIDDIVVAKNYLTESEIQELDKLVSVFLDFAEMRAHKNMKFSMQNWMDHLHSFLQFYDYHVLSGNGDEKKNIANQHAKTEYIKYKQTIKHEQYTLI